MNESYQWHQDQIETSLAALYDVTVKSVNDNISWYTKSARNRKTWAQRLRFFALILLGIGTVVPIMIDLIQQRTGESIPASIASLFLATGTGLIIFDRYMGYSTSWMNFISTEMTLKTKLDHFRYEWELQRIALEGKAPTSEQASMFVNLCLAMRREVNGMLEQETRRWMEEFQRNMKMLDENFNAAKEAHRPGAINLTVEEGHLFVDGWELLINNQSKGKHIGTAAALVDLQPGIIQLCVKAKHPTSNQTVACAKAIFLEPGQIAETSLRLN